MVTWCVYSIELLGRANALLPIWRRKSETSREMNYGEIKAYYFILLGIISPNVYYTMSNQQPEYILVQRLSLKWE